MYAINYIQKNVLITSSECQNKFGGAIDPSKWNNAIEIAEARFVLPLLGYNLYTDMCNAKNVVVTSGNIALLQSYFDAQYTPAGTVTLTVGMIVNAVELPTMSAAYQLLWNSNLWKYVYECVYFVALSANYAQFSAQGIMKSNPIASAIGDTHTASVGISLNDVKWLEDRSLLDRINPLQTVLEQFLCTNKGSYTLYDSRRCEDCNKKSQRTTSFILDVYDEDDSYYHKHKEVQPVTPVPAPFTTTCGILIKISATPDGTLFALCNLQTMQSQWVGGNTLTLPNLIGKPVLISGAFYNSSPVIIGTTNTGGQIGYNQATGTFDRTIQGGFNDGDTFTFLYTETM